MVESMLFSVDNSTFKLAISSAPEGATFAPLITKYKKAETVIQTNIIHWFLCERFRFSNFMGK